MKEKIIDTTSLYIIDFMLDYYTKEYIKLGHKCLEDTHLYNNINYILFQSNSLKKIDDAIFEKINNKIQLIRNYLNDIYKIPDNSVFYFFTLLPPYEVKTLDENQNLVTANNVYFDRNTPNHIFLDNKEVINREGLGNYLRQFFIGYNEKNAYIKPISNYIGTIHLTEILIRSIFFFVINDDATPKEKEALLNIFTWMVVSSFQNLFNIQTRHWKVGYYFRSLLKYLFFDNSEQIQIYDEYSNNIKRNMKNYYNNTTKKLKSYLSDDITSTKALVKFPNNLSYLKMSLLQKNNSDYWIACPFFLITGKEFDKNYNNHLNLCIAIGTYNGFNSNGFFFNNVVLSYSNL